MRDKNPSKLDIFLFLLLFAYIVYLPELVERVLIKLGL